MAKDFYDVLGVSRKADEKEIKAAYRKLARKYHPDVNPNDKEAEKRFKEIGEAYETLKDPEKKKLYDQFGADYEKVSGGGGYQRPQSGGSQGFESIFGDFFQSFNMGGEPFSTYSRASVAATDLEQTVEISLNEVDSGTRRTLTYRTDDACSTCDGSGAVQLTGGRQSGKCPTCGGRGTVSHSRKVEVKIPAGIIEGKKLRVPGGGVRGSQKRAGDLYVVAKIAPNPLFKRNGDNIETLVEVDYLDAVLGGTATVPTLGSSGSITIPAGTQSGQVIRLKGKGLTSMKGGKGDLHVRVKITVPREVSGKERDLLEQIRKGRSAK